MKKLVFLVAMALTVSTATFGRENVVKADTTSVLVDGKYIMYVNANSLVNYLELEEDQKEFVIHVQRAFESALQEAGDLEGLEREKKVKAAKNYVEVNMYNILNERQYKKYLQQLNMALANRGIY